MAVWSEITSRNIADSGRIDSEHFKPQYLKIEYNLKGNDCMWKYVKDIIHPCEFPRRYDKSGWSVLRTQNVRPMSIEIEGNEIHLTENIASTLTKNRIEFGDILVTRTGANFGQTSLFTDERENAIVTSHTLIIKTNNRINPAFLAIFLNTRYGRALIDKGMYGSSQPEIAPKFLKKIPVPKFEGTEEEKISNNVYLAYKLKQNSQSLYTQAQQLLEQELGLDKLTFEKPVGYEAQFSEAAVSARFDSEHYFPEFNSFINNLPKRIKLVPLAQLLNFCQRGKQPIYSKSGARVINSKHILNNKIVTEGNRYAKLNPVAQFNISHGDTLINGTGRGTIGRSAAYLETELAVPDNHVTILRTNVLDPVYLANFLNSKAGQLQVEKHQRGSSGQLELYPFDIRKFLVWDAPLQVQKEIRDLHEKAFSAEKQSKALLEQAKSRVESLIEEAAAK